MDFSGGGGQRKLQKSTTKLSTFIFVKFLRVGQNRAVLKLLRCFHIKDNYLGRFIRSVERNHETENVKLDICIVCSPMHFEGFLLNWY